MPGMLGNARLSCRRTISFESISLQQTVCLSPDFALPPQKAGLFPRECGAEQAAVERDRRGVVMWRPWAAISLSGQISVPQRGWERCRNEVDRAMQGRALYADRARHAVTVRVGSSKAKVADARPAADTSAPAAHRTADEAVTLDC